MNLRDSEVLDFLKKNVNKDGFTDLTMKDIGKRLFYTSTSIAFALKSLEKEGFIKREPIVGKPGKCKRIYLLKSD